MQLGARWNVGESPHRSVPLAMHQAIAEQETLHPTASAWTLTWLESLPRCALDDVALLTLDDSGLAVLEGESGSDDDDDWLN